MPAARVPYAMARSSGGNQSVAVVWKAAPGPKQEMFFFIRTGIGMLEVQAARPVMEEHLGYILAFFGSVVNITGPERASRSANKSKAPPPPKRPDIYDLLPAA